MTICETANDASRMPTGPAANAATDVVAEKTPHKTPTVISLLVLATFIVILNETIMINAIPRLMADFAVPEGTAQWLSTAFMLTMAAVIPVTGWFLQRVTTRGAYATAMALFCTGTALAAAAPVFEVLLAARIIQATGTAVMMPLLMTTLMTVVPAPDRGRVMGNVTLAMSVAPALGPAISGVVLSLGSWRLMFLLVLPIALVIGWSGLRRLENIGEPQPGTVDWFSVGAAAFGFGGLVYGLSGFGHGDLLRPIGILTAGALAIAAFVGRQLWLQRNGVPLMDLRALKHRTFRLSLALMSLAFMAMLGSMILLPLYLQNLRHLSPLQTGLLVMPGGLAMGLLGPSVGKVFDRFGGRGLVISGSFGIVLALTTLTQVSLTMPFWQLLAAHVLLMISLAAVFTPVFTLGLGALPMHLYSHGSSMLGTLQQVAAAFGTALVITIMSARTQSLIDAGRGQIQATLGGLRLAFLVGAALSVLVVVVALRLPGRLPAAGSGDDAGTAAAPLQ